LAKRPYAADPGFAPRDPGRPEAPRRFSGRARRARRGARLARAPRSQSRRPAPPCQIRSPAAWRPWRRTRSRRRTARPG